MAVRLADCGIDLKLGELLKIKKNKRNERIGNANLISPCVEEVLIRPAIIITAVYHHYYVNGSHM